MSETLSKIGTSPAQLDRQADWSQEDWQNFWLDVREFARSTTAIVGQKVLGDFNRTSQRQTEDKADGTLITESDAWADRELRAAIAARFPDHGLLSEEGNHDLSDRDWCWVIDPIDGTTNFAYGIPIWGISLGLLYRGEPVFGWVECPSIGQSFHGFWAGATGLTMPTGAFCNDRSIQVSQADLSANHCFSFCTRSIRQAPQPFPCKIRMLGVASYNLLTVATGQTLGGLEVSPKVWDLAGIWPILQAAGVVWRSLSAKPPFPIVPGVDYGQRSTPLLVAASPALLDRFSQVLGL